MFLEFQILRQLSEDFLGQCPRLILDFPASSGQLVFILYLSCIHILYWVMSLYLYVAKCLGLYMYHACDEYLY